jgi:hypothetical protein
MQKTTFLYNVPFDYTISGQTDLYIEVTAYQVNEGAAIYFDDFSAYKILLVTKWPEVLKEIEQIAIKSLSIILTTKTKNND